MNRCPDDGTCHHGCVSGCFRVAHCVPFTTHNSGSETWPAADIVSHGVYVGPDSITEAIVR